MACFPTSPLVHTAQIYIPDFTTSALHAPELSPDANVELSRKFDCVVSGPIYIVALACLVAPVMLMATLSGYHTSLADNGPTLAVPPPLPSNVTTAVTRSATLGI